MTQNSIKNVPKTYWDENAAHFHPNKFALPFLGLPTASASHNSSIYPKPFKNKLRLLFGFFNAPQLTCASTRRCVALKKPLTFARGFVATIELHSNQIWWDLRGFYNLVGVLEKFLKIKKAGH